MLGLVTTVDAAQQVRTRPGTTPARSQRSAHLVLRVDQRIAQDVGIFHHAIRKTTRQAVRDVEMPARQTLERVAKRNLIGSPDIAMVTFVVERGSVALQAQPHLECPVVVLPEPFVEAARACNRLAAHEESVQRKQIAMDGSREKVAP